MRPSAGSEVLLDVFHRALFARTFMLATHAETITAGAQESGY
jgi:hypothetical protein